MDGAAALIAIGALVIGLALGWWVGARPAAQLRTERDRLDERSRAAESAQAAAVARAEQAELLRTTLNEVTRERDEAHRAISDLAARQEERERAFDALHRQLLENKEALSAQFNEVGAKLLADAQRQFLERADQRFAQANEKGEAQLKALLTPVETTLKRYEEGLQRVEKDRTDSYGALKEAVTQLAQGNEVVRKETARLTNVLRSSPKHRGRWGEEQLQTILESAGLAENVDFELQAAAHDGERQLRPDCVVKLPGGRCIVIDVKCPLVHFEQAFDEEDEIVRKNLLKDHADAMRNYATSLGRKGYQRQFDLSPEFVIMFIPGEHFLSAAAERVPEMIEEAFRGGVVIASTINMLALAKVMAGMWREETRQKEAQAIAEEGRKLYAGLRKVSEHMADVGKGLTRAVGAYGSLVGSLEGSVYSAAKRLDALKVDTGGKAIEPMPVIETAVRPLTKLSAVDDVPAQAAE